jgi:hypothetical protein
VTRLSRYLAYKDPRYGGLHESEIDGLEANDQNLQIEKRDVGKNHLFDVTRLKSSVI